MSQDIARERATIQAELAEALGVPADTSWRELIDFARHLNATERNLQGEKDSVIARNRVLVRDNARLEVERDEARSGWDAEIRAADRLRERRDALSQLLRGMARRAVQRRHWLAASHARNETLERASSLFDLHRRIDALERQQQGHVCGDECDRSQHVAQAMEGLGEALDAQPRTWRHGDPEPEGVKRVRDREGDVWMRHSEDRWIVEGSGVSPEDAPSWGALTHSWSPITEATP
jgi:hypothetical protein